MAKRKKKTTTRTLRTPLFAQRVAAKTPAVAAHRDPVDEQAATELVMYIENESDLSPDGPSGQGRSVLLNALRKWKKGTYDPKLGVKLFEYLAEAGAKRYAKEMGSSPKEWSTMFNPATRHEAAKQLEASFRNSAENGEYDHVDTRIGREAREVEGRKHRGIYHDTGAQDGDYVIHVDHRGAFIVDRVERGGTHTTIGSTRGFKTGREALEAAARDSHNRGNATGVVFLAHGEEMSQIGNIMGSRFVPGGGETIEHTENFIERTLKRIRAPREASESRMISMTYGTLPPFEKFAQDIRRISSETDEPYWPEGTDYPMELVSNREIELANDFGGFDEFSGQYGKPGFRGDERQIYDFLVFLMSQEDAYDFDSEDSPGSLASSIMYTLGYEWV